MDFCATIGRMQTIRAFIAIHLPENVKQELGRVNDQLAALAPAGSVRWVRPELIHLTLRFLGDTAVAQLPRLAAALDQAAAQHAPCTLRLGRVGCFPNCRRPRVIWAGLQGDLAQVTALKQALDGALAPLGWEAEDRPFAPHLTLGRVSDGRKTQGVAWEARVEALEVPVTAVHLLESQLTPRGPIYTVRHTSRLTGGSSPKPSANR
jgi:RNA 2',3'-cyclic 3'-phosphodiesterase